MDRQEAYRILAARLNAYSQASSDDIPEEESAVGDSGMLYTLSFKLDESSEGVALCGEIRDSNTHRFEMLEESVSLND